MSLYIINFISILLLSLLVYLLINYLEHNRNSHSLINKLHHNIRFNGSSVSCTSHGFNRNCEFKNIYYKVSSKEFVFIRNEKTKILGLSDYSDFGNEGFVEVS